jgi:protease-4
MVRKMILDSYDWFVGIVSERRAMSRAEATALADGSIFTGRQALAKKLVDAVGGEREAIAWLATKGVDGNLKVVEWKAKKTGSSWLLSDSYARALARWLGLPEYDADLIERLGGDRIFLDGLLSLWHPE